MRTGLGVLANYILRPFGMELRPVQIEQPPPGPPDFPNLPECYLAGCRVLPDRELLLSVLPKGGTIAEIGVADGDFSAAIWRSTQPSHMHLIDSWQSERYADGLEPVRTRFAREIALGQVLIHQGNSLAILPTLAAGTFDWVYLDTSHTYQETSDELRQCARIVSPEGRIVGHDFCIGNPQSRLPYGVIGAVYDFCLECRWMFEYLTLDRGGYFSFCLKAGNA